MSVSPAPTIIAASGPDRVSSIRSARDSAPSLHQSHQRLVTLAQGHAWDDIAADADAADRLATARLIDRQQRDPLILEMTRLFTAIRHDLNTSAASRALAAQGEAKGKEAIRVDRAIDEHTDFAEQGVDLSIEAGRALVAVQELLLTGRAASERCGRRHPLADELAEHGVVLAPCHLSKHEAGRCVFLSVAGPCEGDDDDAA